MQLNKPKQVTTQRRKSYHSRVASYDTQCGNTLNLFHKNWAHTDPQFSSNNTTVLWKVTSQKNSQIRLTRSSVWRQ